MSDRIRVTLVVAASLWAAVGSAQERPAVRDLRRAYEEFQLDSVVRQGYRLREAGGLTRSEIAQVWELTAFSYAAMDSTAQAVEAFRELIRIDPDREPDVLRVAPRITSLYASALGQVVVVRRVRADSASFVAGTGALPVRFQVSRPARVTVRAIGPGLDTLVDSLTTSGDTRVDWRAIGPDGEPVASGRYQILIAAAAGRDEFQAAQAVDVVRSIVDTVEHLLSLPEYELRPEMVPTPRSFRPMVMTGIFFALAVGAGRALENPSLGGAAATGALAVGTASLLASGALSLRQPPPTRVEVNVLYNQLVRSELARRNDEIARQNADRRRQTRLTIAPVPRRGL
jgi:hypothetical protein